MRTAPLLDAWQQREVRVSSRNMYSAGVMPACLSGSTALWLAREPGQPLRMRVFS
jgi:hypothetical protein